MSRLLYHLATPPCPSDSTAGIIPDMPDTVDATAREPVQGVVLDLLMAVMDSLEVWSGAAGDHRRGLAWHDAVTARMVAHPSYAPYEDLVVVAARELGLPATAATDLFDRWPEMSPWPDAAAISRLTVPYGFVIELFEGIGRDRRAAIGIDACLRARGRRSRLVQARGQDLSRSLPQGGVAAGAHAVRCWIHVRQRGRTPGRPAGVPRRARTEVEAFRSLTHHACCARW